MRGRVGSLGTWLAAGIGALAVAFMLTAAARGKDRAPGPAAAAKPDYLGQWIALIEESQKELAGKPNGYVPLREACKRYEALSETWQEQADARWPDGSVDFIMLTADNVEPKYASTMEATRWALGEAEREGLFGLIEQVRATPRAVFEPDADLEPTILAQTPMSIGPLRLMFCMTLGRAMIAADAGDWRGAIAGVDQALSISRAVERQPLLINALVANSLDQLAVRRVQSMSRRPGFDETTAAAFADLLDRKLRRTPWEFVMRGEAIFGLAMLDSAHYWRSNAPDARLNQISAVELAIMLEPVEDMALELAGRRLPWWRQAARSVNQWLMRRAADSPCVEAMTYLLPRRMRIELAFAEALRLRGRAMDEPFWRRRDASEVRREIAARLPSGEYLAGSLAGEFIGDMKPLMKAAKMRDIVMMQRDATLLMLAIERHRMRHGGALPARIEELDADLAPPSMIDQATGEPLRYRSATAEEAAAGERAYVIYSVGADKQDDGGRFERGEDAPYGFYETKPGFDFPVVGVGARR